MEHNGVWNIYIYMCVCVCVCVYIYKTGMSEIESHLIYNKDNKGKYLGKSGLFTMWFGFSGYLLGVKWLLSLYSNHKPKSTSEGLQI